MLERKKDKKKKQLINLLERMKHCPRVGKRFHDSGLLLPLKPFVRFLVNKG